MSKIRLEQKQMKSSNITKRNQGRSKQTDDETEQCKP